MDGLAPLTDAQQTLADQRARCTVAAAEAESRANPTAFVSLRDVRATAKRAGTPAPEYAAERDMIRAAGVGRFKTAALLGEWELLVCATEEAARFHGEAIDLAAAARSSLAWCLADRPVGHPIAQQARLARDIGIDDVHNEQLRPSYRELLDGWARLL